MVGRMGKWTESTMIELIMICFITMLGVMIHWLAGIILFGLGILIHTITWLITRKDAEDNTNEKDKEVKNK